MQYRNQRSLILWIFWQFIYVFYFVHTFINSELSNLFMPHDILIILSIVNFQFNYASWYFIILSMMNFPIYLYLMIFSLFYACWILWFLYMPRDVLIILCLLSCVFFIYHMILFIILCLLSLLCSCLNWLFIMSYFQVE